MALPVDLRAELYEGEDIDLAAHLVNNLGADLLAAGVSNVNYALYDLDSDSPDTAVASSSGIHATVMKTSLTTGNGWSKNSTGYTFRHTVAASGYTPVGGRTYRAQYTITRSAGGIQFFVAILSVKSIF